MLTDRKTDLYELLAEDPAAAVTAILAATEDGVLDDSLRPLAEALVERSKLLVRQRDRQKEPTHQIVGDVRPRYLAGTKGRAGGWVSDSRREFFPAPGTEAYARNRRWRVSGWSIVALAPAGE
jgi:hypothetical protein